MAASDVGPALETASLVIHNCLAGRIRQINRVVTARYDEELRAVGVTTNQLTILAVVAMLEKVTPTDLQPYLQMEMSTLSRNVARMMENHWLATLPGEDKRSHYLVVAPDGMRVLAGVRPHWERAQSWAVEHLGGVDPIRELAWRVNPLVPR